jgi:hypothetical protein
LYEYQVISVVNKVAEKLPEGVVAIAEAAELVQVLLCKCKKALNLYSLIRGVETNSISHFVIF